MASPHFSTLSEILWHFGPQLLYAVLCGGMIGLERELKNKAAGIKTNMLICVGSTLFTSMSLVMSLDSGSSQGDQTRIAAQVVSGIGFLGGGTIIQSRGAITGLTTAATIWVVSAIGVCIGSGHPGVGLLWSLSVILVLVLTSLFEDRILGRTLSFNLVIVFSDADQEVKGRVNNALTENDLLLNDFNISSHQGFTTMTLHYKGHRTNNRKFVLDLWHIPGVKEVRPS
ncbi:MAG: MgtC/SapB family protein [Bdellovibrionia bacterium]